MPALCQNAAGMWGQGEGAAWIALRSALSDRTARRALACFGSPAAVLTASHAALEASGLSRAVAEGVRSACLEDAAAEYERIVELRARLVPCTHEEYPVLLSE